MGLTMFDTVLGWMGILDSPDGLKQIVLPQKSPEKVLSQIIDRHNLTQASNDISPGDLPQRLKLYLGGNPVTFSSKLDLSGATCFQQDVWQIVQSIPYGETRSYTWTARQLGLPKAARAIGQALARNPLPIIIPCHRVIASNGSLGGFSGGIEMKTCLLNIEAGLI